MDPPLYQENSRHPLSFFSSKTQLVYERNEQRFSTHVWRLYGLQWLVNILYTVVSGYAIARAAQFSQRKS